jgi:hypothetical protein
VTYLAAKLPCVPEGGFRAIDSRVTNCAEQSKSWDVAGECEYDTTSVECSVVESAVLELILNCNGVIDRTVDDLSDTDNIFRFLSEQCLQRCVDRAIPRLVLDIHRYRAHARAHGLPQRRYGVYRVGGHAHLLRHRLG